MQENNLLLSIKNLKKKLGDFQLGPLSIDIYQGEYIVLLGPTGAGKSMFLQLICGILTPDEGEIWMKGKKINHLYPEEREIGIVYQDYLLFPHMNVEKNINFGKKYYIKKTGISNKLYEERVHHIIDVLGIRHLLKRRVQGLSGGEQQRIALARSLVLSPGILLLDEPLSAVDSSLHGKLIEEIKKIVKEFNQTIIHITHNREEAFFLGSRIVVVNNGKFEQIGTRSCVLKKPLSLFVARFLGGMNIFKGEFCEYEKNDTMSIKLGDIHFQYKPAENSAREKQDVHLFISHNDMHISHERIPAFDYNLPCTIVEIQQKFTIIIVSCRIECDIVLDVVVSYQEYERFKLKTGDRYFLNFNNEILHVI
ncbi:MAG: ATP-binding cassette domain-containing protein [Spirochaetales bacterium]|nr:ATP-binding cassette domain-containing protein [Spirochaetales bacterium]